MAEAQKRARVALFLATLASAAILAAEWNSYFSWDRQWAELAERDRPAPWARAQLLEQQIKSWIDTNSVNVAVVGLRMSVSDAAVIGSIILLVAAFYVYMTAQRENVEVAAAVRETLNGSRDEQEYVYAHMRTSAVFDRLAENGDPIDNIWRTDRIRRRSLVPSAHSTLIYLPAITIFLVVGTDIYFAFAYFSPWRGNIAALYFELPFQYKIQLIAMDLFALIFGAITISFCRSAHRSQLATSKLIAQFRDAIDVQKDYVVRSKRWWQATKLAILIVASWKALKIIAKESSG
jgi:archaellum component FlaF (FlaF/FlaG flagellin family)